MPYKIVSVSDVDDESTHVGLVLAWGARAEIKVGISLAKPMEVRNRKKELACTERWLLRVAYPKRILEDAPTIAKLMRTSLAIERDFYGRRYFINMFVLHLLVKHWGLGATGLAHDNELIKTIHHHHTFFMELHNWLDTFNLWASNGLPNWELEDVEGMVLLIDEEYKARQNVEV